MTSLYFFLCNISAKTRKDYIIVKDITSLFWTFKAGVMCGTCCTHCRHKKCVQNFRLETWRKEGSWEI
jgi:hypothetical protein